MKRACGSQPVQACVRRWLAVVLVVAAALLWVPAVQAQADANGHLETPFWVAGSSAATLAHMQAVQAAQAKNAEPPLAMAMRQQMAQRADANGKPRNGKPSADGPSAADAALPAAMLSAVAGAMPPAAGGRKGGPLNAAAAENSAPWAIVFGLTLLTLLPAILLAMTPMVRLLVVFHFLRQALGTQTAPSNQVLMGLALMMTWFLMQPVLLQVERDAVTPYRANQISAEVAMDRGIAPVKAYMLRYAREKDLEVFASAGVVHVPATRAELPMPVVVPAYMLSELKAGFGIGAVLFLPFLLVDLVVASVTTSIGMLQLSPVVISTPVKILLFVMVDGWALLAHELVRSF